MTITEAQREIRTRYVGGYYGQLVAGLVWLVSAALGTWVGPRPAIGMVLIGGFFIFPLTELLVRTVAGAAPVSADNSLQSLGMQVALVLPLSMPLLAPVAYYRLNWFYPALMLLVGAHYLPFVFLYGMRVFWALGTLLVSAGMVIALRWSAAFSAGAWFAGVVLVVFAVFARGLVQAERDARSESQSRNRR